MFRIFREQLIGRPKKAVLNFQSGIGDIAQLLAGSSVYNYKIVPYNNGAYALAYSNQESIEGDIVDKTAPKHLETCANLWCKNSGGDLSTMITSQILFEDYGYYNGTQNSFIGPYKNTKVQFEREVTHECKIKDGYFYGYGKIDDKNTDDYICIAGEIEQLAHPQFVDADNYEVYIIPGMHPEVSGADFIHENGHVNAKSLKGYEHYWSPFVNSTLDKSKKYTVDELKALNNAGLKFSYLIKEADLPNPDPNHEYTFFVKANYKDATSGQSKVVAKEADSNPLLAPTFHSLMALGATTTGAENIFADDVKEEETPAQYYNLNGVAVDGENLAPGIYIVRQGNTARRILVK